MSSYNRIEKIKYTKNPSDVVALQEYILFEDEKAEEKYVVFKFMNNVNQRLRELRFEVLQYDGDNELIEKSVVVHDNFVAEPNAAFVPNAKLKVNFECQSLRVNLVSASFDRVKWEKGEFCDNSYRFDSYAKDAGVFASAGAPAQVAPAPQRPPKNGFVIRNVFRKNIAVFPKVFLAFVCIAVIVFVAVTLFLFKDSSSRFSLEDFDLEKVSDGYVTVCGYDGLESELTIPAKIGDYTVSKIASNAFKNSKVKSIVFETEDIVVETNAFVNCKSLTSVSSALSTGRITVLTNGFVNCGNLETVYLPTAQITKCSFNGCLSVTEFCIDCFPGDAVYPLIRVFGEEVEAMSMKRVEINFRTSEEYFLQDMFVLTFIQH